MVLAALAALALTAPAASAADADVIAAWASQNAALKDATADLTKAMRKGERTKFRRPAPVVRAIKRMVKLTVTAGRLVAAQTASTASGARAREDAMKSLQGFVASLRDMRGAIVAASRKKLGRARKLLRRSKQRADAAQQAQGTAVQLFQAAQREAAPPPAPPSAPPGQPSSPPPCEDKDPNAAGCQTEPPCEDKDPNAAGCQTQPPCEDKDPNVSGCQTQCEADQDPNNSGCQTSCDDKNNDAAGCQSKPSCRDDADQAGCPLICQATPSDPSCAASPPGLLARRRSTLGGLLRVLDPAADEVGAVVRADL